jgi:tetratricopeptide (TPR) repeat protein
MNKAFATPRALALAMAFGLLSTLLACSVNKARISPPSAQEMPAPATADYYYLLYQDLERQGKAKEAAEALEKLIALSPDPDLYLDLANNYWALAMPDKTREVLNQGIAKYPEEKKLYFYLANSYVLQRRYDEGVKVLRDFLAQHPKDQATAQELGAMLVESGRNQEALDFLAQVPKAMRTPAMTYYEAKAYVGLGKTKQAIEHLNLALRQDPQMLAALSELAFLYEEAKDYRQAEEAYKRILDLGESGPEVWLRLIKLALKEKNPGKALAIMNDAPGDRTFLFETLGLFVDAGYNDGAAKVLERLAKEEPGNPDVIFIQAVMAVERDKNLDKAMTMLAQIPKTSSIYDKSLTTRLQLALDNNRTDVMPALIAEGKAMYPDRIDFWFFESLMYEKQDKLDQAEEVLKQAVAKWPDNTEAMYRLGSILERRSKRPEALQMMEKILVQDPSNPDALNFVGYTLAEEGQDLDRALELVQRALVASPDNPYFIDSLAWVFYKRGDVKQAWVEIQRAVNSSANDPAIWEHYGDIAKALGRKQEAAQGYRKALELNPANAQEIQNKLGQP